MRFLKHIVTITLIMSAFYSCSEDYLDVTPQGKLSPTTFWQEEASAMRALVTVYDACNSWE